VIESNGDFFIGTTPAPKWNRFVSLKHHVIAKDLWKCDVGKKIERRDEANQEQDIFFHVETINRIKIQQQRFRYSRWDNVNSCQLISLKMLIKPLHQTITNWIDELDHYTLTELRRKPSPESWSLGQVYFHLIDNTRYYVEQARICLSSDDHRHEQPSPEGVAMLANDEFPDAIIEGPDTNTHFPQPGSKDELKSALLKVQDEISIFVLLISSGRRTGKTKHPGLGYFNAHEWLQFADMHFRHHLKQKKRIDDFLKDNSMR
jgi:DinB superfamily